MRYLSLYDVKSSEFENKDFLRLNNCGAFLIADHGIRTCRPHGRKDYQLLYVQNGSLRASFADGERTLPAGTILLFRPHEPQIYRTVGHDASYYWIHFTGTLSERLLAFFHTPFCTIGAFPEFEAFCTAAIREHAEQNIGYETLICGQLITLLAQIERRCAAPRVGAHRAAIDKVVLRIRLHSEENVSNEVYAAEAGLSTSQFIRAFKAQTGQSPQNYRTAVRMENARSLLREGELRIGEIATLLGYDDPLYFSRVFKKHTGVSPREFA